jgi:predicted porin
MKKSLIALAVMAAAGAASAQSSVTLFGIVDATLQWSKSSGGIAPATGDVRFRVTNSGYNSSRLGFRGTEDLGGGLSASFWLEAGVNNDDGSGQATSLNNQATTTTGGGLTFNRRSTVSLAGRNWGELRIGRDYTPQFWNLTVFDPFGTNGAGTTATLQTGFTGATTVRASNSIGYFAPATLGGFYGQVQYYENENPNSIGAAIDDGSGWGARVGFASGPFNVAAAYGKTQLSTGDITQANIAGQWDFGMAKLLGQFTFDEGYFGGLYTDGTGWLLGALVPVGAGEIRVAYSQYEVDGVAGADPRVRKFALGYVHNLSKRTAVYTTWAHVRANDGATAANAGAAARVNGRSNVIDLGVRHSF